MKAVEETTRERNATTFRNFIVVAFYYRIGQGRVLAYLKRNNRKGYRQWESFTNPGNRDAEEGLITPLLLFFFLFFLARHLQKKKMDDALFVVPVLRFLGLCVIPRGDEMTSLLYARLTIDWRF